MDPTAAAANDFNNRGPPAKTARQDAAGPVGPKKHDDVLGPRPAALSRPQAISRPRAGAEWPLRSDWSPRVLHHQVKRIWRVSVFMLFLLLLATAVHIVQLFVPPANLGSNSCRQQQQQQKSVMHNVLAAAAAGRGPQQGR